FILFFQAEDGIRDLIVTGVQTCALPIYIPLDRVKADERLGAMLARLPGRRFVFTNGDAPYARKVLEAIGVHAQFDDLHDIHASQIGRASCRERPRMLAQSASVTSECQ